jgi:hypothetical protein
MEIKHNICNFKVRCLDKEVSLKSVARESVAIKIKR